MSKFKKNLVYFVIEASIVLIIVELFLRIFDPIGYDYFDEATRYSSNMKPDSRFEYIHNPGYNDLLQGVQVLINNQGFRGPNFEVTKPDEKRRLMILGDSMVFGWGAPQNKIFPVQLQNLFDQSKIDIEVIPAGVGSWNTRTEYEYLKSLGLDLKPDIILLLITENDLEPHKNCKTDVSKELLFANTNESSKSIFEKVWMAATYRFYTFGYIQYYIKINSERDKYLKYTKDTPQWEDAKLALNGIITICREENISLIIFLYASEDYVSGSNVFRLYKEFLNLNKIQFFTLPDTLFSKIKYRNTIVDGHPNAQGHKIIANEIFKVITSKAEDYND